MIPTPRKGDSLEYILQSVIDDLNGVTSAVYVPTTSQTLTANTGTYTTVDPAYDVSLSDQKGNQITVEELVHVKQELTAIKDRLAILDDPSPERLEKYRALKNAYETYKKLETILHEDK